MARIKVICNKCGVELDLTPYGEATRDSVTKLGSDHASKLGCDYPAANGVKVLAEFKEAYRLLPTPLKKEVIVLPPTAPVK